MRKYWSIWQHLKKNKLCAIAAHVSLHRRIIKAVINEKDRDKGFKLLNITDHKRIILRYTREESKITFYLHEYDNLTGISTTELGGSNEGIRSESPQSCEVFTISGSIED